MTLKVMQRHKRPLLCQNHSRTFVYEPIFIKICMNANSMKTQFFHKMKYDLRGRERSQKVILTFKNLLFLQ